MNKSIITLSLILVSLFTYSQNVVVKGKAPGKVNKLVRIIVYSDQFSNLEHTLATTRTDEKGEFTMKFLLDETQFAFLALGLDKGEFYISPGSTYNINIHSDTLALSGSIFDRLPLNFTVNADDNGIQQAIGDFNVSYNDFIYNNANSIYKSRDKSVVTNFVAKMSDKYSINNSKYVSNYVEYSLASLLWLSRKESNSKILENYFVNKPVLYNNIQYTDFFKEFFKSYFNTEQIFTYSEIVMSINKPGIEEFTSLLTRNNKLVSDNRVLEIVEMLVLARNYYNRDVSKKAVEDKLNQISNQSQYIENKKIASNFMIELKSMQNGSPAPNFTLLNENKDTINLDYFRGKYVLLSFVKEDCKICNFQMNEISDIQKEIGSTMEVATIIAGNQSNVLSDYAKERGINWPILDTGDDILIFEDYHIVAYPTYILINPNGTIGYAHLPMPEENMILYIKRFMDNYKNK